jgi:hypothetical protein
MSNITGLYNLSAMADVNSIAGIASYANSNTEGVLIGGIMIIIFFIIVLMGSAKTSIIRSIAISGFICFGLSLFLRSVGLISMLVVIIFLMLGIFGVLITYYGAE